MPPSGSFCPVVQEFEERKGAKGRCLAMSAFKVLNLPRRKDQNFSV